MMRKNIRKDENECELSGVSGDLWRECEGFEIVEKREGCRRSATVCYKGH